jgi:hypothetical protein
VLDVGLAVKELDEVEVAVVRLLQLVVGELRKIGTLLYPF